MIKAAILFGLVSLGVMVLGVRLFAFEEDTFKTSQGELKIGFIGHGTLMLTFGGKVIHVDPVGSYADYKKLPQADLILVTHEHSDHLDPGAIGILRKSNTDVVGTENCAEKLQNMIVMKNGESRVFQGFKVEAVPAYNIVHMRGPGAPFHPKGQGNGYVLTFGDKRVYVGGDTENIPEMKDLKNIDIAFLPMNLPYTMTPEMVADAAKVFKPKILYPYHFANTETSKLVELLKNEKGIEVRIRNLK
jgi:L-ascorbate metabolism protein UlaG (beta-lactamase superfamily)